MRGRTERQATMLHGTIPLGSDHMPDAISYDAGNERLLVGTGFVENVSPAVWDYEVSGKPVLRQWFSYRKKTRDRPIIGDRRKPSLLGEIHPDRWLPEYTTELLNLLNVLALLVDLEPEQARLLEEICSSATIGEMESRAAGAFANESPPSRTRKGKGLTGNAPLPLDVGT